MKLFKPFQVDDLARALCVDGAIIAWEQGLGKSLAAIALGILKEARRTLIIGPEDLHRQLPACAAHFFGKSLRPLRSIEHFYKLRLDRPHSGQPQFFFASYTAIGLNEADEWTDTFGHKGQPKPSAPLLRKRREWCRRHGIKWREDFDEGIGESQRGITCIFTPTLARVIAAHDAFDCVIVDEGTKLQATEARIAASIRLLNPAYRYVLTGTPIKNRLESVFWLCAWAAGRYGRWPYASTDDARERFADTFLQTERFLTREQENPLARHTRRRSNRICAVHRLWKTLSPAIIRRRKADCGEDIPPKIVKPIIVPPGKAQLAVYQYHLLNPPLRSRAGNHYLKRREQVGMQLTLLRLAALCPTAESLAESFTGAPGPRRSWTEFTPKFAACLSLVRDCLNRGQQIIIGSPFREFSTTLHARLQEAKISSLLLDGKISAAKRGDLAAEFKSGKYAVLIAGIKAMGVGHSFENCSNIVVPGYSFALDENEQFTHRIWRLNSPAPITVYPIITQGTIDERLHDIFTEKRDAAALAIDGRLFAEMATEVDLESLIAQTIQAFDANASTVDETSIEDQWGHTALALSKAEKSFWRHRPANGSLIVPAELHDAMATLKIPSPTQLTVDILRKHYRAGTYRKVSAGTLKRLRRKKP